MSRYFFNVFDDLVTLDEEGLDLPNLDAARLKALQGAPDLICEQVRHGSIMLSHWIDVVDEAGATLLRLTFREAVDIRD